MFSTAVAAEGYFGEVPDADKTRGIVSELGLLLQILNSVKSSQNPRLVSSCSLAPC